VIERITSEPWISTQPSVRFVCPGCGGKGWINGRESFPAVCPFCIQRQKVEQEMQDAAARRDARSRLRVLKGVAP